MLVTQGQLKKIKEKYKGSRIILASGVFDLFHVGHLEYLTRLKKKGKILVVNVVNDKRVKKLKGKSRPVISQSNRAKIIDALKIVDYTVINPRFIGDFTALEAIKILKPAYFGAEKLEAKKKIQFHSPSTRIVLNKKNKKFSTTEILQRIKLNKTSY